MHSVVAQNLPLSISMAQKHNGQQLRRGIIGNIMFQALAMLFVPTAQYQSMIELCKKKAYVALV